MATLSVPEKDILDQDKALSVEGLKSHVPARLRSNITPELVTHLNEMADDPEIRRNFRENILGFMEVLQEPNISIQAYLSAVKYVSYKLMDMSNQQAWSKTFPDRHERMLAENKGDDAIRAAVSAYNKGKIVNMVMEQAMVPTWVLNCDIHQKAINRLAYLMVASKSEKVQADSAASLLTHLKPPEAKKVDLEIGIREDESVMAMRKAMTDLVDAKRKEIESGNATAGEIAASKIIDVEVEHVK